MRMMFFLDAFLMLHNQNWATQHRILNFKFFLSTFVHKNPRYERQVESKSQFVEKLEFAFFILYAIGSQVLWVPTRYCTANSQGTEGHTEPITQYTGRYLSTGHWRLPRRFCDGWWFGRCWRHTPMASIKISRPAARLPRYGGSVPTTQVGKAVVHAVVFKGIVSRDEYLFF